MKTRTEIIAMTQENFRNSTYCVDWDEFLTWARERFHSQKNTNVIKRLAAEMKRHTEARRFYGFDKPYYFVNCNNVFPSFEKQLWEAGYKPLFGLQRKMVFGFIP